MNFEVNLMVLIKPFFFIKSCEKLKYLENEKRF